MILRSKKFARVHEIRLDKINISNLGHLGASKNLHHFTKNNRESST